MAYGTPSSLAEVDAYYTHIRHGRPPAPAQVAELVARYEAIGGTSPLASQTEAQRTAIARALDERALGEFTVALGNKHAAPFIEEAIGSLADEGVDAVVGLVLAPHYSRAGVGQYHERGAAAAVARGLGYVTIDSWHLEPEFLAYHAVVVSEARAALPVRHKVLFTAHSLPERALIDDPYPDQLRESATAIAERVGMSPWPEWAICWQSAGKKRDDWRGPDVGEVIRELGATGRSEAGDTPG